MDMDAFMEQARVLQDKVNAAQELLDKTTIRGMAADGACIVTMTGKYDLKDLYISDELARRGAAEIAAVVAAAYRDAKSKADTTIDRVMGDATAGMPIPE